MGKRSDFERVEKDFYRTIDPRAVQALLPHILYKVRYWEPCCGDGDLIAWLGYEGANCVQATDISMGVDALTIGRTDYPIITNPPWSRPILHAMIDHFTEIAPYAWLLFDADWAHTRQSAPYMQKCTDIISVGRLIWIPGTTTSGKDNCAWYRFSKDKDGPTRFHGRTPKPSLLQSISTYNSADDDNYTMGDLK